MLIEDQTAPGMPGTSRARLLEMIFSLKVPLPRHWLRQRDRLCHRSHARTQRTPSCKTSSSFPRAINDGRYSGGSTLRVGNLGF